MRKHSRFVLAAIAGLTLALLRGGPVSAAVQVGDKPDLAFVDVMSKQNVSLEMLRGKIVVIDFWATWCGPCMAEAGHMVKLNEEFGPKGLQILGVSLDNGAAAIMPVVKQKGFSWPQACDGLGWKSAYAAQFGVHGIPCTFIISPDGEVLWTGHPGGIDGPLAKAFQEHPPTMIDPKTAAAAKQALDDAEKALTADDLGAAAKALAKVPSEVSKEKELAKRLMEAKAKVDAGIAAIVDDAQKLADQKQFVDAAVKLKGAIAKLGDSPAGSKLRQKLSSIMDDAEARKQITAAEKTIRAQEALDAAQKFKDGGKDSIAYARFKAIVAEFPGTAAATAAAEAIKAYETANPDWLKKQSAVNPAETKAKAILNLAQGYQASGHNELARKKYQEVINQFPNTEWAEQAKKALEDLGQ